MNNLKLVETDVFNEIATCDFWGNANNEYLVTREQIGRALGYSNPANAIKNIHLKHKERLDKFSTQLTLGYVEGDRYVERERILYNRKGIMEICRWSRQPLADKFMDWCWEIMDRLISNSLNTVTLSREEYSMIINTVNEVGQLNKVNEQLTRQLQNHFCTEHHNARQTFSYVAENNAYCSTCALFFLEKQNVSENCFACKDLRLYK